MVSFVDAHRGAFGVAAICRILTEYGVRISPETYFAARRRSPSARTVRDERVLIEIRRVYAASRGRYGARRVYQRLRQEGGVDGAAVARCTVERLMRAAALQGVRPGRVAGSRRPHAGAESGRA